MPESDARDDLRFGEQAPPSLYYLRTFHAVATQRSFTRAGRALDLSQPAVSAHVRALERYFGARLFEMRQRRVHLTAAGQALFTYTQRVFNLLDEAGRAVVATQRAERGLLRLGASPTIGVYLLPAMLAEFHAEHPEVQIDVFIGPTAEVIARVVADHLPLGLVEAPVSHRDLLVDRVGEDELVLVAPKNHPLARLRQVEPHELADVPLLRREAGSGTRALVDAALLRAGVNPPTLMELGSPEALKQAVLAGVGLAWLPRLNVARELATDQLAQVAVVDLSVRRVLSAVRRHDRDPLPVTHACLDLLRASAGQALRSM
jgi:DNA-binding transcriptional LysR family regulator